MHFLCSRCSFNSSTLGFHVLCSFAFSLDDLSFVLTPQRFSCCSAGSTTPWPTRLPWLSPQPPPGTHGHPRGPDCLMASYMSQVRPSDFAHEQRLRSLLSSRTLERNRVIPLEFPREFHVMWPTGAVKQSPIGLEA